MNTFIRKLSLLISVTILFSCTSSKPISSNKFEGYSEIERGDFAVMSWDFENAKEVKVEKYEEKFDPVDSVKVAPDITTEYNITALHESDTVVYTWKVNVIDTEEKIAESIEETPEKPKPKKENKVTKESNFNIPTSSEKSEFLKGTIGPEVAPGNLKVLKLNKKEDNLELNTLLLDENGNFINGLTKNQLDISFIEECTKSSFSISDIDSEEFHSDKNADISIIFDNSYAAEFNFSILEYILIFSENLKFEDRLMFSYFNQNFTEYVSLLQSKDFYESFRNYDLPKPEGLSAIYKSLYENLVDFTSLTKPEREKAIILITFSEDNSSLVYSPEDISNAANNFGIPIYIIGVGNAVDSYTLRYITNSTGGRYYQINEENMYQIENILSEIHFSLNNYYKLSLKYDNNKDECLNADSKVILKMGEKNIKDNFVLFPKTKDETSDYQAIATFKPKSSEIDSSYANNIFELSNVLKSNPAYKIKLTGHSADEGTNEFNYKISTERVEEVKNKFITLGVSSEQLISTSEGFAKPVYYLEQTPWQKEYNRRVEVDWINPSNNSPFEITVEQVWSEADAIASMKKWDKRGYNAYYENYLIDGEPAYRVKLWGYSNEKEVKIETSKIIDKYNISATYKK